MKLSGFIGSAYKLDSVNVDAQECINLYLESIESGDGKEGQIKYLRGTEGLKLIQTVGDGPIRCIHVDSIGRIFIVSGNKLYTLNNKSTSKFQFIPTSYSAATSTSMSSTDNTVTAASHGFYTGLKVQGTSSPTGLTDDTDYWIIKVDADTVKFASTLANALAGTAIDISSSDDSSLAMTITPQIPDDVKNIKYSSLDFDDDLVNKTAHGLYDGLEVKVKANALIPTGILLDTTYYVTNSETNSFQLATSLSNASSSTEITFTDIDDRWESTLIGADGEFGGDTKTFSTDSGLVRAASMSFGGNGDDSSTVFVDGVDNYLYLDDSGDFSFGTLGSISSAIATFDLTDDVIVSIQQSFHDYIGKNVKITADTADNPALSLNNDWNAIAFGNNTFVAVAEGFDDTNKNQIMTSPDGATWTVQDVDGDWNSIVYGNGMFVAVGPSSDSQTNQIITSLDGITWSAALVDSNKSFWQVAYGEILGDKIFVAVTIDGYIATSSDGLTWTVDDFEAIAGRVDRLTFGNGRFVAIGNETATGGIATVYTSDNGLNWSSGTDQAWFFRSNVIYADSKFVGISGRDGFSHSIVSSTDGITWSESSALSSTQNLNAIAYGNGTFVIIASNTSASADVLTSSDASTWSSSTGPQGAWSALTYGKGKFVAVSSFDDTAAATVTYSTDASTWGSDFTVFSLTNNGITGDPVFEISIKIPTSGSLTTAEFVEYLQTGKVTGKNIVSDATIGSGLFSTSSGGGTQTCSDAFGSDGKTEEFSTSSNADFGYGTVPTATQIVWSDSRFILNAFGTNKFWVSDLQSFNVNTLSFASSEGDPDVLIALAVNNRLLYAFNEKTTEIYADTGNVNFPFERVTGGFLEVGIQAEASLAKINNILCWLGRSEDGDGIVYAMSGMTYQRISTHPIEQEIRGYADPSTAVGFAYQSGGHFFYVLNFDEATWTYDLAAKAWHKRAYTNSGVLERHRAQTHAFALKQGLHLVGDYSNNNVYSYDKDTFDDNGTEITRLRSAPHLSSGLNRVFCSKFQLDMETGVGLDSGQGSDPQVILQWSDDGGHTWSNEQWTSAGGQVGGVGDYKKRVIWRRLGSFRDRIFRVKITDPVKVRLIDAQIDVEAGAS